MPDSKTNLYECMYIVDPTVDADQLEAVIQHMEDSVRSAGGEVTEHYDWRRRTFAFRIRKWTEGVYRLLYFQGAGTILDEVKRNALTDERVIRLMIVVANPRAIYRPRAVAPEPADEEAEAAGPAAEAAEPAAEAAGPAAEAAGPAAEAAEPAPEDETVQDAPDDDEDADDEHDAEDDAEDDADDDADDEDED